MFSMSWTSEDLAKLEKAIKTGALEVEYSTGRVRYRSLQEMLQLRSIMRQDLGLVKIVKKITPKPSKGF